MAVMWLIATNCTWVMISGYPDTAMTLDILSQNAIRRCLHLLLVTVGIYIVLNIMALQRLFQQDAEGAAALLAVVGTLYSVLYAFATYVIWGQYSAVESEILKEAGALKNLMLFSQPLKPDVREPMVRAIKVYAKAVVETEWEALSRHQPIERTDRYFREVISSVSGIKLEGESERALYERLLEIANEASAHRDERLSLSVKRMPRTLLLFVSAAAAAILLLLFLFPFRSPVLGAVAVGITTVLFYLAYFVVTDLDNPFEGTWNVTSDPFGELITKFR